ncbi:MAG: site-specific integrase [Acidobacteriota bacterium]
MSKTKAKRKLAGSVFQRSYRDRNGERQVTATWFLKYYSNGKPIVVPTGLEDYDEACAMLHDKMAAALRPLNQASDQAQVCVGHCLDLMIATYKTEKRKSLYDTQLRVNKHLRKALDPVKVHALSSAVLRGYVRDRQKAEASPATINKELAWLRHALNLGAREEPPMVLRVPHFAMLPTDNAREGTLTHEQYRAVRDLLPAYARIALVIAYYTGARKGEITTLRREHIDLKGKRILLVGRNTKNGSARYLPIYGDMIAELDMAVSAMKPGCPFLLQENGRRIHSFRKAWAAACKGAKLGATLFHDLRRTAVTMMIDAGLSEKQAMEISGHKTRLVFDRYHIVSSQRLREMGTKLGEHMKEKEAAVPPADRGLPS